MKTIHGGRRECNRGLKRGLYGDGLVGRITDQIQG